MSEESQAAAPMIRAHLDESSVTVFPGSRATVRVAISNSSDADAEFHVEAAGLPADWVKPAGLRFPLPAHETTQLQFLIKPERRAEIAPQTFRLDILVSRLDYPARQLRLNCAVALGDFGGLSAEIEPRACRNGGSVNLYLLNQGNKALDLELAGHDPQSRLDFRMSQTSLRLPPGGRAQVVTQVRAPRPMIGQTSQAPFAIVANAANAANYRVPLQACVIIEPRFSSRAASLLLMLCLAAAVIIAALAYQAPQPSIASFSLSEETVARGAPAQLAWQAENARRFLIEVDGVRLAELSTEARSFRLDTGAYREPIVIALIAERGDAIAMTSRRLDIYEPVIIAEFTADRRSMLRHVTGTFTIRWAVSGAHTLEISPPPGFAVLSESPQSNPSGWLTLRGMPDTAIVARLLASDERGNVTERSLQIGIRDPECSPRQDVWLYAGPDSRHARLSIAVAHVPVLARGTNPKRDWLQVELARGEIGWAAYSNFFCQGFSPAGMKIVTELPALPTAAPGFRLSPSPAPPEDPY